MRAAQAQVDVWRARAKVNRRLASMTFSQQRKYLAGARARLKAKTGIDLDLPVLRLERNLAGGKRR